MSLHVGDPAPDFSVPAVLEDGNISLSAFRGRDGVLVGLYRGLHCPFCRRHLAQLNLVRERLAPLGTATVAIVNTPLERARLYFRNQPKGVRIGADPDRRLRRDRRRRSDAGTPWHPAGRPVSCRPRRDRTLALHRSGGEPER